MVPLGRHVANSLLDTAGLDFSPDLPQRRLDTGNNVLTRVDNEMLALHRVRNGLAHLASPP
jgi:hypothetical protein